MLTYERRSSPRSGSAAVAFSGDKDTVFDEGEDEENCGDDDDNDDDDGESGRTRLAAEPGRAVDRGRVGGDGSRRGGDSTLCCCCCCCWYCCCCCCGEENDNNDGGDDKSSGDVSEFECECGGVEFSLLAEGGRSGNASISEDREEEAEALPG